jgi:hypothetical protein
MNPNAQATSPASGVAIEIMANEYIEPNPDQLGDEWFGDVLPPNPPQLIREIPEQTRNYFVDRLQETLPLTALMYYGIGQLLCGLVFYLIIPLIEEGSTYFHQPVAIILLLHTILSFLFTPSWYFSIYNIYYLVLMLLFRQVCTFCLLLSLFICVLVAPPHGILWSILVIGMVLELIPFYIVQKWATDAYITTLSWNADNIYVA